MLTKSTKRITRTSTRNFMTNLSHFVNFSRSLRLNFPRFSKRPLYFLHFKCRNPLNLRNFRIVWNANPTILRGYKRSIQPRPNNRVIRVSNRVCFHIRNIMKFDPKVNRIKLLKKKELLSGSRSAHTRCP